MTTESFETPATRACRGMELRAVLTAFTVTALAAIAVVGAVSLWSAHKADLAATQTFVAMDVTADILPTPLYLIEMRLVLSQGLEETPPLNQVGS